MCKISQKNIFKNFNLYIKIFIEYSNLEFEKINELFFGNY